MAVFRRQHLRMGAVCLAHRLVQVFCRQFLTASQQPSSPQRAGAQEIPSCQVSSGVLIIYFPLRLLHSHRERSLSAHCIAVDPVCLH